MNFDNITERFVDPNDSELHTSGYEQYIEALKEFRFQSELRDNVWLPGQGFVGKQSCGQYILKGCLEPHENNTSLPVKFVISHCHNRLCNTCFESWIQRESSKITDRISLYCEYKRTDLAENKRQRLPVHVVVSPPPDEFDTLQFQKSKEYRSKIRKKAYAILKSRCVKQSGVDYDLDGAVLIEHGYRFKEGLEGIKSFTPHFHFIIMGYLNFDMVKELYQYDGWFIKKLSVSEDRLALRNTVAYLLSHSTFFLNDDPIKSSNEHSVRYYGELQNRNYKTLSVNDVSQSSKKHILKLLSTYAQKVIKETDDSTLMPTPDEIFKKNGIKIQSHQNN